MSDCAAEKRKEVEASTAVESDKADAADAKKAKIEASEPVKAAAEETAEPDAKRAKTSVCTPAVVRKQVEYYLCDDNLKHDKFFHEKISADADGWLALALILSCAKMKALGATKDDVVVALKESTLEVKEGGEAVRRPANAPLPKLEERPQHAKKSSLHAHDGGVVAVFKNVPEEKSWAQIKEKLKEKLPQKVALWFVSEVSDKSECFISSAPFEGDVQVFDSLELDVGDAKLKCEVCHGEVLQKALKLVPKHIRDKRDREMKKRQKERNRPILIGTQRFANVAALRGRVKEILNSRSDGEQLKTDGSDYKLIKALIEFHPNPEKSKGMVGIKVGKAAVGDNRCFHMIREGGDSEDVSSKKCLDVIEANPPYVKQESQEKKEEEKKGDAPKAAEEKPQEKNEGNKDDAKPVEAAEEKKSDAIPAEAASNKE